MLPCSTFWARDPMKHRLLRSTASGLLRLAPRPLERWLRSSAERLAFNRTPVIHELPPAFHYWSNAYLRPRLEAIGYASPDDFFLQELIRLAGGRPLRCLSLGAGRCEGEIALVQRLREAGVDCCFVCIDLNDRLLQAGRQAAAQAGLADLFEFVASDVSRLQPLGRFDAVLANQCLHHFVELEAVFDAIAAVIGDDGLLLTADVIGRNGHRLWPEALDEVQAFWRQMPERLRIDRASGRVLAEYDNHDYADVGFEGIRAQDILSSLIERFEFDVFVAYACIVIPFVDRRFGHNLDPGRDDDRELIDRIARRDQQLIDAGTIKPTQMLAALRRGPARRRVRLDGLEPEACVRRPG